MHVRLFSHIPLVFSYNNPYLSIPSIQRLSLRHPRNECVLSRLMHPPNKRLTLIAHPLEFVLAHLIAKFAFAPPPASPSPSLSGSSSPPSGKRQTKLRWRLGGIVVPGIIDDSADDSTGKSQVKGSSPACPLLVSLAPERGGSGEGREGRREENYGEMWDEGETEWEEMEF